MPSFSKSSLEKLETCDGRLQRLFNEVIKYTDCTVVCGHRGRAEQEAAFDAGFSKVHFPNSKHNKTPALAADVVPYPIDWHDVERFKEFAKLVFECANRLELEGLTWGGGWTDFPDYPHWELKA
jgi:peptidoglycan LD-endopeptidase CwlK